MLRKVFGILLVVSLFASLLVFSYAENKQLSDEFIKNRTERRAQFNRLLDAMEQKKAASTDIDLTNYYGGSYIDENENLVVQVTNDSKEIVKNVREITGNKNLKVVKCKYSEAKLSEVIDTLVSFHKEFVEQGIELDFFYDDIKKGAVCIIGKNLNEKTQAIIKSYVDFDSLVFIESETGYREDIGDPVDIGQVATTSSVSVSLAGGDRIWRIEGTTTYPLTFGFGDTKNGDNGLVTTSHGTLVTDKDVYYQTGSISYNPIGTVTVDNAGGSSDAAFAVANSGFNVSSWLRDGKNISYASTNSSFPIDDTVYRVGTTGYASGTIYSNNGSTSDGIYSSLLVCTYSSSGGDSGGPIVMHDYGDNYILIGIHKGSGGEYGIASKYKYINDDLGIVAIVNN